MVLDANLNARLIDFGLAREKNDNTSMTKAGKECYNHPDFGKESAKESWDYFAFGVGMINEYMHILNRFNLIFILPK